MKRFSSHSPFSLFVAGLLIVVVLSLGFFVVRFPVLWILAGCGLGLVSVLIARRPWHGLLLFVFFLPFERIGSYDVAGMTIRPSQVIIVLTMIVVAVQQLRARRIHIPSIPFLFPLGVFIAVSFLGLIAAPNLQRSLFVLCFILFTLTIALFIPFVVRTKGDIASLIPFLLASCAVVTLYGIFQFAGDIIGLPTFITGLRDLYTKDVLGFPRVQSTALEPLYFANYLLIPLGVMLSLFVRRGELMRRWSMIALLGLALINLFFTVARGGYIAFGALVFVLVIFHFRYLFQLRLLAIATGILFFGAIVTTQFLNVQDIADGAGDLFQHVGNLFTGASYVERVETFTTAMRAWREHPWIGMGTGSFGPYESAHPFVIPADGWQIVNNEYLEILAENGIIGLLAMVSIFAIVIIRSVKAIVRARDAQLKMIMIGFLAAFVGILVQWNTFSTLYIVHIWFTIGMLTAMQNMILRDTHDDYSS